MSRIAGAASGALKLLVLFVTVTAVGAVGFLVGMGAQKGLDLINNQDCSITDPGTGTGGTATSNMALMAAIKHDTYDTLKNPNLMLAMLGGSHLESGWVAKAVGAGSYGPYQIQNPGSPTGPNPHITVAQAQNPAYSTNYMLLRYVVGVKHVSPTLWSLDPKGAMEQAVFNAEHPARHYSDGRASAVQAAYAASLDAMKKMGVPTNFGLRLDPKTTTTVVAKADAPTPDVPAGCTTTTASGDAKLAVEAAATQIGVPYVMGGESPKSPDKPGFPGAFDCSGLVQWALSKAGVKISRVAHTQWNDTKAHQVSMDQAQAGDLVFFVGTEAGASMTNPKHVGLVSDPTKHLMIAAPHTGAVVRYEDYSKDSDLVGFTHPYTDSAAAAPGDSQGWRLPLPAGSYHLSSPYGKRFHPVLKVWKLHDGQDMAAPEGTPIYAASNGVVKKAKKVYGYGNFVVIEHAGNIKTGYGHMVRFASGIVPGVTVNKGQVIGYVGQTGLATGNHLHFMVWANGQTVNPYIPRGSGSPPAGFMPEHGVNF